MGTEIKDLKKPGIQDPKKKDSKPKARKATSIFALIIIPIELIIAILVFKYIFGAPSNFVDNNPANNPLTGNMMGIVYKGGWVVPILMTTFLITVTYFFERWITIRRAKGKGNLTRFLMTIREHVSTANIDAAKKACDMQRGSLANIIRAGLGKYQEMDKVEGVIVEKKVLAVQKELDEATGIELPMLEKNLIILATIASIATLLGLFGTVLGMIRAFAALAHAGAPDAIALANGISEALVNTAGGIGTSMLAIIFYNYFTTQIDQIIYLAGEAGQTITHTFAYHHSDKSDK
jgi:biopolymer transport protein ExbB